MLLIIVTQLITLLLIIVTFNYDVTNNSNTANYIATNNKTANYNVTNNNHVAFAVTIYRIYT